MRLRLIREMLGYIIVGLISGYLFLKSDAGSFFSVILVLSCVSCLLLTGSTFKAIFRRIERFQVGKVIIPHEYNMEFQEGEEFTIKSIENHEYICENKNNKIIRIPISKEKHWKLK